MTKSKGANRPRFKWREEVEVLMLKQHYANTPTKSLALVFGCTPTQVLRKANSLGLTKTHEYLSQMSRQLLADPSHGANKTWFQKGSVPVNKGKKHPPGWAPGNMARTQFKPGSRPHTWVPVGSYRVVEGTLELKVNDLPGASNVRWKPVHRLLWEAANGPVPEGHVIAFKPGRKSAKPEEVTLDCVECISRAENALRNSIHTLPPEIAELHRLRGSLNRQIHKRAKQLKDEHHEHPQQEH